MKLKNEQEIKALAKINREKLYRKWTGNMCREQASDIEGIVIQTYTQAQQDLLASASEGFEEWHNLKTGNGTMVAHFSLEEAWQASKLSQVKEIATLKGVLDSYGNMEVKLDLLSGENEKLQKENEELKKIIDSIELNLVLMLSSYGDNTRTEKLIKDSLIAIRGEVR